MHYIFNIHILYFQWNIQVQRHKKQSDTLGCGSEAGSELEVRIYELSTYTVYAIWIIEVEEVS